MEEIKTIAQGAEVIKELGITGILACLVIVLFLVVRHLHQKREEDKNIIIKLAQGKDIE